MSISSSTTMSGSMSITKKKNTILLIQKLLQNVFVNFLIIKNKENMTEENSCFVILTNYLNERLCRHCKFPNERPFPGLKGEFDGGSFKRGRSSNFSTMKRDAHSKEAFIQAEAFFHIITTVFANQVFPLVSMNVKLRKVEIDGQK